MDWLETIWQTKLPQQSKLLACYLRRFMNSERDMAYPSYARIIEETGMARSTVAKYLEVLESEGWLVRDSGFKGKNTIYYASYPKLIEQNSKLPASTPHELLSKQGSTPHELSSTPDELSSTPREHELDNKQDNELDNNNIYVHFDEFWSLYPRKTNRKAAETLFNKMKVTNDVFVKISQHLRVAFLNTQKQYIPHATTYLNNERWNDEVIQSERRNEFNQPSKQSHHAAIYAALTDPAKAVDF